MAKIACKQCGSEWHTKMKCPENPEAVAKAKATQQRMLDKQRLKAVKSRSKPSKPKKAKTTQSTRSALKKRAWKAFSDFIRTRDSLATTGTIEYCICITCNERGDSSWKPYKKIQAGHAVGGRSNIILFHEEIVNGQCDYCNQKPPKGLGGDYGNYAIALIKRHGLEYVQALQRLKGQTLKYNSSDFMAIEAKYKLKLAELLNK